MHVRAQERPSKELAVECRGLVKTYGGIHALRGVDLEVPVGSVEALVGQNGAGKSTLVGILSGRVVPTDGHIRILGHEPAPGDPRAARAAGLVTIYQELTLIPGLSAEENVFLGRTPNARGVVDRRAIRRRYNEFCGRLGVSIPPRALASELSVADRQVLEIMRALVADARVLILDEPTAALAAAEREALLALVSQLRDQQVTVIYISHNLEEVLRISDHITVLRDGSVADAGPRSYWDRPRLVNAMLGESAHALAEQLLDETPEDAKRSRPIRIRSIATSKHPILEAHEVSLEGAITDIDISVQPGEIVGLGGLVGSGRTSLMRCLAGLEPSSRGRLLIDGAPVRWPRSPRRALRNGVAMIPEDRKESGLVLGMRAMDNVALPDLSSVATMGWLSTRRMQGQIAGFIGEFGFDPQRLSATAAQLSGGNQQKLLLGRWRFSMPRVLLADEPTRGIDVGAKEEVLQSLRRFADNGLGVIMASSELEDVSLVADRVLVLAEGRAVAELTRDGGPISIHEILDAAYLSPVAERRERERV